MQSITEADWEWASNVGDKFVVQKRPLPEDDHKLYEQIEPVTLPALLLCAMIVAHDTKDHDEFRRLGSAFPAVRAVYVAKTSQAVDPVPAEPIAPERPIVAPRKGSGGEVPRGQGLTSGDMGS